MKTKSPPFPPHDELYEALVKRDESFEGVFIVGVKSTGIFCRPTCPARKPLQRNCEFFPSAREAMSAGYRACKRCEPLDRGRMLPADVRELMQRIRAAPAERITDDDLRRDGYDASTVRRHFKSALGMTFQAYHRAHRLGLAFAELSGRSADILASADRAGYESASGFHAAYAALFGVTPGATPDLNAEERVLRCAWIETELGPMIAVVDGTGVCLLEFCDRRGLEAELAWLRKRYRATIAPADHPLFDQLRAELEGYFAGKHATFDVPLSLPGSEFQRSVWAELCRIPNGTTVSYGAQARAIGRPTAVRAVARANGDNRVAIFVPCHRVIGSDGSLTGYGGGLWRKRWLLDHERRMVENTDAPPARECDRAIERACVKADISRPRRAAARA
jgi:AraC family transcriptional regulator of adaptative response/methylated-DNA-[protein]-cysteine methyltransferase